MIFTPTTQTQARVPVLLAFVVTAACWAAWGETRGLAAAVGSAISVVNWLAMGWLVGRLFESSGPVRGAAGLLLVLKMGALMASVAVAVVHFQLDHLGLMLGLSILFVGPILGALSAEEGSKVRVSTAAGSTGKEL